ncbi:MAG: DUF58 domain-containing protein [Nanoarchaeota archaeon]
MPIQELRLRLVPDIFKLEVGAKRDILSQALEGDFTTLFKGKGIEFAGYREYTYTDDASLIDWAASLRSKKTLIREFEVQKNFHVFFLLDVSDKMLFCSTRQNKLKAEHGAELVSRLAYAMAKSNNAIGLAMFTDKFTAKLYPELGTGMVARINQELSNPAHYGGNFSFKKALQYTNSFLKERSLIIIISDFIGLEEGWVGYVRNLMVQHEIIGIMLRDPRDEELPENYGQYVLENPFGSDRLLIDLKEYGKLYTAFVKDEEDYIMNSFGKGAYNLIKLRTDKDFTRPLMAFFKKRAQMYKYV